MFRIVTAALFGLLLSVTAAFAQTCPTFSQGIVLTPGQWNACFASKQNALGYTPVNKAGDAMTGPLITAPSTTLQAGFRIPVGVAPTTPTNGDMWSTASGLFVRVNGATVGPLVGAGGAAFAGTSPITVSFPSNVVTYAFDFTVANTFRAVQYFSLNSGALPTAITGSTLRAAQANGTTTRIVAEGYAAIGAMTIARANGTAASPTQVLSGDQIGGFNAFAWGSNAAWNGPISSVRVYAAENITATAWGSKICFATTPVTTAVIADSLCQQASGGLTVGSPTGSDKGAGTLNLTASLYDNGTAPTGTAGYVRSTSPTLVTPALGVATATSLAIGGATIGGNGLAVTGTVLFNSALTYGGVTLTNAVSGTGAMVLTASAALTGTPTTPTAALHTNTTQIASTAFVVAEVAGSIAGVASLNSLTGSLVESSTVQTFCPSGCTTTIASGGSGTYTPSSGTIYAVVMTTGAGGGGGGATSSSAFGQAGGGGGAGSTTTCVLSAANIGASKTIAIGALGAGGASGANNGSPGGDTTVGSTLCVGKGASGGLSGGTAALPGAGGAGGVAGSGTNPITSVGAPGLSSSTTAVTGGYSGAAGGSSQFGGGGIAPVTASAAVNGNAASGCGGGGSGGAAFGVSTNAAGGDATAGCVKIIEFRLN